MVLDFFKKNATRPLKHRDENIESQRRKGHNGYAKNIVVFPLRSSRLCG